MPCRIGIVSQLINISYLLTLSWFPFFVVSWHFLAKKFAQNAGMWIIGIRTDPNVPSFRDLSGISDIASTSIQVRYEGQLSCQH